MLGEDRPELVETMLRNIFSEGEEPLLQRKVFFDNVGADGLKRVRRGMRPEREKRVLQTAAVIGREFTEPILRRVVELPEAELAAALQRRTCRSLGEVEMLLEDELQPLPPTQARRV